jgi:hypothetical protein
MMTQVFVQAGTVKGRLYDERGCCNTHANPLRLTITTIEPGRLWNVHIGFLSVSRAHVDVLFDLDVMHNPARNGALFASGLLFGDSATEYVTNEHGEVVYNHADRRPVMRAPIVISGPFTGAVLVDKDEGDGNDVPLRIRVDAAELLPFYLEIPFQL